MSATLPASAQEAYDWHARPGAFERLSPPWRDVQVIERVGQSLAVGSRLTLRMKVLGLPRTWVAEHVAAEPGRMFRDVQVSGPFARWEHTHHFDPVDSATCRLTDSIEYQLPLGALGRLLGAGKVRRDLQAVFIWRHRVTANDLAMHARHRGRPRMTVAITGASGLVGSALCHLLTTGGHRVIRLVRSGGIRTTSRLAQQKPDSGMPADERDTAHWSVDAGLLEPDKLEGVDAIVHLAGDNLAAGRWTTAKLKRIRDSRVAASENLVKSILRLAAPPRVFIGASAIGYYGDTGGRTVDESGEQGSGFLAELVRGWERAAYPLAEAGIRTVHARLGVVITPRGGALAKMLTPFRLGLGGPFGHGRQWFSWISLDDAIAAIHHLLMTDALKGPVNLTAPQPVRNRESTRALGRVLSRPAFAPFPAPIARWVFGKMADEMLLTGAGVLPRRLLDSGFVFRDADYEAALRWMLGRMDVAPAAAKLSLPN